MPLIAAVRFRIAVTFPGRGRLEGLRVGGGRNDRGNEEKRGERYRGRVQVEHYIHSHVGPMQNRSCGGHDRAARGSNVCAVIFFLRAARPGWSHGGVLVEFCVERAGVDDDG